MSSHPLAGSPHWNDGTERRLHVSLLAAAVVVLGGLSLLRWPEIPVLDPLVELVVRFSSEDPGTEAAPEPAPVERPVDDPSRAEPAVPDPLLEEASAEMQPPADVPGSPLIDEPLPASVAPVLEEPEPAMPAEVGEPRPSWEDAGTASIGAILDEQAKTESMNPTLDALRESNGERYRPRTIPLPKPIWENAEPDQLGRTVLRHGDCFKVLDDPNVGRRDQFELFDQYIVQCMFVRRPPQELPWVKDIRERYLYLSDPDGYLKGSPDDPAVGDGAAADQE